VSAKEIQSLLKITTFPKITLVAEIQLTEWPWSDIVYWV